MKIVRIRTLKDRIITLSVIKKTDTAYIGVDKFGKDEIISFDEIKSLQEIEGSQNAEL